MQFLLQKIGRFKPAPKASQRSQKLTLLAAGSSNQDYWSLSADATLAKEHPAASWDLGDLISFSLEDIEIPLDPNLSLSETRNEAQGLLGTEISYSNLLKSHGFLYATPLASASSTENKGRIYSGRALLRQYIHENITQDKSLEGQVAVVGMLFKGSIQQVMLLFRREQTGEYTKMAYVPFSDDDERSVVANFIQSTGISQNGKIDDNLMLVFPALDVLSCLPSIKPYPDQGEFFGLPNSTALAGLAAITLVTAAGCTGWAITTQLQLLKAQSQTRLAADATNALALTNKALVQSRFIDILSQSSVSIQAIINDAIILHGPLTEVELVKATPASAEYRLSFTGPITSLDKYKAALTKKLPPGCVVGKTSVTKGLVQTYVYYECKKADTGIYSVLSSVL